MKRHGHGKKGGMFSMLKKFTTGSKPKVDVYPQASKMFNLNQPNHLGFVNTQPKQGPIQTVEEFPFPEIKGIHTFANSVADLVGPVKMQESIVQNLNKENPIYHNEHQKMMSYRRQLTAAIEESRIKFKNEEFTFTRPTPVPENNITVWGKMVIFPCLQELRWFYGMGTVVNSEKEQQRGYWDPVKHTLTNMDEGSMYTNSSDAYYRYWTGTPIPMNDEFRITKNGLFEIPNCSNIGMKLDGKNLKCRDLDLNEKWKMITQYFITMNRTNQITAMTIVSHHNRLKSGGIFQKLIPRSELGDGLSFANLFTLVIHIDKSKRQPAMVHVDIVVNGFPDKGGFAKLETDQYGKDKVSISRKGKTYINDKKYINTEVIINAIQKSFEEEDEIKGGVITISRHGNALHNAPVSIQPQSKRLDSSLTPLAFLQAKIAASSLIEHLKGKQVIIAASFLGRTQLTGALLLQYAGATMEKPMLQFVDYMKQQSYYRFFETGKSFDIFQGYAPFNDPSFDKKTFKDIEIEANAYKEKVFPMSQTILSSNNSAAEAAKPVPIQSKHLNNLLETPNNSPDPIRQRVLNTNVQAKAAAEEAAKTAGGAKSRNRSVKNRRRKRSSRKR